MLLGLTHGAGPILKKHASKHPCGGSRMMVQPRTSKCSAVACGGSGSRAQAPSRQRPSNRAASPVHSHWHLDCLRAGGALHSGRASAQRRHDCCRLSVRARSEDELSTSHRSRRVWLSVPAVRNECRAPSPRMRSCSNLGEWSLIVKSSGLLAGAGGAPCRGPDQRGMKRRC